MTQTFEAPKLFKPMLAHALPANKTIDDYADGKHVLEQKYDGHRLLVAVTPTHIHAYSRGGNTRVLPDHILDELKLVPPGTYDGELLVPGGTSTDVTSLHLVKRLELQLFDILAIGDDTCMHTTGEERRKLLVDACSALNKETSCISVAEQFEVTAAELQRIWDSGGEGVIVKHKDQKYLEGKRPHGWVKFKKQAAAEVNIIGFEDGRNGPHSIILCEDDDGIPVRTKARDTSWLKQFEVDATSYIGRRLTISYQQRTADGKYRHPMADHIIGD